MNACSRWDRAAEGGSVPPSTPATNTHIPKTTLYAKGNYKGKTASKNQYSWLRTFFYEGTRRLLSLGLGLELALEYGLSLDQNFI